MTRFAFADLAVFAVCIVGVVLFGCSFAFRKDGGDATDFMTGGGRLPAWAVGMSIFATFLSSISFLALPAKAYATNWNAFVFNLSIPVAAIIAAKWFVPYYRAQTSPSAYACLEARFGAWARVYASLCHLLTQIARTGAILYLLALPMESLLGWPVPVVITATAVGTALYSMTGGIRAVVWTDAIEGIILIAGALGCLVFLLGTMPGGAVAAFQSVADAGKFSLGSFSLSDWSSETFWLCLVYGLFMNLQNYGIDQNYVQRYMTGKTQKEAVRSALFGSLLYPPVALVFFLIGTALWAWYTRAPEPLPPEIASAPDKVFPHFIATALPTGARGLLVAAIFAAGMSTISTSLNSGATVFLEDWWRRFARRSNARDITVLRVTTAALAALGCGAAFLMTRAKSALDAWWALSSIFSGGMLGLFLLGLCARRARAGAAAVGTLSGILAIVWIVLLQDALPLPARLHTNLAIVVGTTAILLVGFLLSTTRRSQKQRRRSGGAAAPCCECQKAGDQARPFDLRNSKDGITAPLMSSK